MARYGMALNYKNCINCKACESACKEENGVLLLKDHYRIWVGVKEAEGQFPHISIASQTYHPSQCQHCSNAPCQMVCPTNATYYGKDGMVMVDPVKCILCTYCINACPYDARYVDQRTMTVDKCTFCSDTRLAAGETTTACQATCPTKVRVFGDLDDPESEISQLLATKEYRRVKEHLGTEPKLFYIL